MNESTDLYVAATTVLASLAMGLIASACGGKNSKARPTVEEYVMQRAELRARVLCRGTYEGCEGKPPSDGRLGGTSPKECMKQAKKGLADGDREIRRRYGYRQAVVEAVAAGTIDYNGKAARKCLSNAKGYVKSLSCIQAKRVQGLVQMDALDRRISKACVRVFEPAANEGDTCEIADECTGDLVCRREPDANEPCGTCQKPQTGTRQFDRSFTYVKKGESCGGPSHDPICNPFEDLVCSPVSKGSSQFECIAAESRNKEETCAWGACKSGLGCVRGECADYDIVGEGASCSLDDTYCKSSLICLRAGSSDPTCESLAGEGDECFDNRQCTGRLWCGPLDRGHRDSGTCEPLRAKGEPCERGKCEDGLYCEYDPQSRERTCRDVPSEGEECPGGRCESGLVCRYDPQTGQRTCEKRQQSQPMSADTHGSCRSQQ